MGIIMKKLLKIFLGLLALVVLWLRFTPLKGMVLKSNPIVVGEIDIEDVVKMRGGKDKFKESEVFPVLIGLKEKIDEESGMAGYIKINEAKEDDFDGMV